MSKKNNDQNQVPEETKEETPEEVTEASQEKQESSQEEALQQALREQEDKYLRLLAEYDNYRKRSQKEKENAWTTARADTIKELLPVYDNLERAAAAEGGEDDPHKKGLEMIFHQFKELLAKEGVKEIEAKGKEFDPELMDAVMHIEDESLGENVVAQVFQAGFELNGKVLRHAIVQVAN